MESALPITGLFQMRPVQTKALDMLRASLKSGKRRPQLMLPTGSGKTIVAAHAVSRALAKGNRVAFTVPLINLIDQTIERFVENGIPMESLGVVQADHSLRRPQAPIQICSLQTLANREFPKCELVFIDESHIQFSTVYEWMEEQPGLIFIGLSATPWAVGMGKYYDDLIIPATTKELIDVGDLCRFRAFAPTRPDLSKVTVTAGDYQLDQLSTVMSEKSLVADVVTTWLDKAEDRPTLLFAVDRSHAAGLHDEFAGMGVPSAYVDAFTDREERAAVKKLFHKGDIKVVCSVGTLIAGLDWNVHCISFCRPTKSPILYMQAIGRGLRKADGKDYLLLLDHSNATLTLGLPTEIHYDKLLMGKRPKGEGVAKKKPLPSPRECPECAQIVAATERYCSCGHIFKYVCKVETRAGELEEIGGTATQKKARAEFTLEEMAVFYGQLRHYALVHDYRRGWPSRNFYARFGFFPNHDRIRNTEPLKPSNATLSWIRGQQQAWAIAQRAKRDYPHLAQAPRQGGSSCGGPE